MNSLDRFRKVNESFPMTDQILEHKSRGGKVFGWLCTYVPEEIIHAAGALPIRIIGYSHEANLDDADAHLYINNCTFSRSCLQLGLEGEYDFLDGVVGGSTCDGARRLFDIWRQYIGTPFHHVLTVPRKYTERAQRLYYDEIVAFKKHFEEYTGVDISDEALHQSTILFNESRSLLRRLYELRKRDKPPISGAETMEVLNAAYRMPKEIFNEWLGELIGDLESSDRACSGRARVMLVGSVLTNPEFVKSIEDQGALVVTDELCTSTRYWGDPVIIDNDRPVLESISRRYLNNFPCARMYPSDERFNRIIDFAKDYRVDGVISQIVRYCVPYAHDLPLLTDRLNGQGIPTLGLDVEYGTSGSGQVATRVQAFIEMLEARDK
ncbi:MAG: 2-hydroxyacyl-CoA dehydratase family protein [Chloroflexota bacterium]|nr:2-hydroxyacyl-CoA dehydratase family protein [Chloroflexota bacterium]